MAAAARDPCTSSEIIATLDELLDDEDALSDPDIPDQDPEYIPHDSDDSEVIDEGDRIGLNNNQPVAATEACQKRESKQTKRSSRKRLRCTSQRNIKQKRLTSCLS